MGAEFSCLGQIVQVDKVPECEGPGLKTNEGGGYGLNSVLVGLHGKGLPYLWESAMSRRDGLFMVSKVPDSITTETHD